MLHKSSPLIRKRFWGELALTLQEQAAVRDALEDAFAVLVAGARVTKLQGSGKAAEIGI